jgi:hypothetical protein
MSHRHGRTEAAIVASQMLAIVSEQLASEVSETAETKEAIASE